MVATAKRLVRTGLAALLVGLAACHDPFAEEALAATPAAAALDVVTVKVTAKGKVHSYKAEVARTPAQQAQGLMYRTKMAQGAGMLFPFPEPRMASFWMANTYLPLDIIFIAPDGKVINVGEGVPLTTQTVNATAPAGSVLELNRGEAARIGLKAGDKVSWAAK